MVQSCLLANTILRTQRLSLPRTICRYKSITAAIERGRQHTSRDQRFGSRPPRDEAVRGSRDGRDGPERRLGRDGGSSDWRSSERASTHRQAGSTAFNGRSEWGAGPSPHRERTTTPQWGRSTGRTFRSGQSEDTSFDRRSKSAWEPGAPRERNTRGQSEDTPSVMRSGPTRDPARPREGRSNFGRSEERSFDKRSERGDERSFRPRQMEERSFDKRSERGEDRGFRPRQMEDRPFDKRPERGEERSFKPRRSEERSFDKRPERSEERSFRPRGPEERSFDKRPERSAERSFGSRHMDDTSRDKRAERAPDSLPYETAASEFLYGHSSVLAAIKANRRKLYKLYIHNRGLNRDGMDAVVQHARAIRLPIQEVGDEYLRVLDKASNGRPHNVSTPTRLLMPTQFTDYPGFYSRIVSAAGASYNRASILLGDIRHI